MTETSDDKLEIIYRATLGAGETIIAALQEVQDQFGYIDEAAVNWLARRAAIPEAKFYGVITFYSQFHLSPRGRTVITVCSGTVCHVKGAPRIVERLHRDLGLKGEQQTTNDRQFTVEQVNCVGACSIAPVVLVNGEVYGTQSPETMARVMKRCREPEHGG